MNETVIQACLRRITELDMSCQPDRIIVELHKPLRSEWDSFGWEIMRRWLCDDNRLTQKRSKWWFVFYNKIRYKNTRKRIIEILPEDEFTRSRRNNFSIETARFAVIQGSELICMEYQWGPLCGGGALWSYDPANGEMVGTKTLWIS